MADPQTTPDAAIHLIAPDDDDVAVAVRALMPGERLLMQRADNRQVFESMVALVNGFKTYFLAHGQPIYENPSPGNRAGGITTLEGKSLGAVQKGGHAQVTQVLRYAERAHRPGLALLESPGSGVTL